MSHLHTLNDPMLLTLCLRAADNGDSVLLIEDGVYNAQSGAAGKIPAGIKIYALQNDVEARGLKNRLDTRVTLASDNDFVTLCCEHDRVINWF